MDIDEDELYKIIRFFIALSTTPEAEQIDIGSVFLTEESIMKNCKEYFGHPCEFFSRRFYAILSLNSPMKRIFFKVYVEKFYEVFLKEGNTNRQKSSFIF